MALNHVFESPRCVVVTASSFQSNFFRSRDLNMINVLAIPYGFPYGIGKPENQQILYSLFPEIMIYSVYLVLFKKSVKILVKCNC